MLLRLPEMGEGSQARHTALEPTLSALGKEQVKCKENPVSKNIPMTLSNIQLLAVRGAGGWLGSVGQHSEETTEINRGGSGQRSTDWAGAMEDGASACSAAPSPQAQLPDAPALQH